MKKTARFLAFVMVICMIMNTIVVSVGANSDNLLTDVVLSDDAAQVSTTDAIPETGTYNEGVALVKYDGVIDSNILDQLNLVSATPLYKGSSWYTVELAADADTAETVNYLRELGCFDAVDFDYIMSTTDKPEDNPNYNDQVNLGLSNIPYGWTQNGKAPGGSPDVVVAVIDSGVDYNHLDLRNNIWINPAEIPDNGRDDDGNGYVDDVYGWDCVGNDNDPMDDNGHGTHVAGIIAAENNKQGGIGVAYNCKVMVIKAGNSSGYLNNSDIAEAVQYAYMNGASVINMSFGGSNISIAVEEALKNAYNTCVLVASAGNDSACNNLGCSVCPAVGVSYPAALPYVIGVMSTDKDGKNISSFSNYDHYPYDSVEYEVYAVGEGVGSTWPANKYAFLYGTSMAAPTVSGIAAILRSEYSDREVYSTKFIQSQIVNTGTVNPYNEPLEETDFAHAVADLQAALTKLPKPAVNLYDYHIDDSTAIAAANNGNGVIDAGETVRLYIELHNRGGVASNVNVSIDTYRNTVGDETLTDPYFTFVNPTMHLSDIGTYSVRESAPDKYFEIIVDANCPNNYLVDFNVRYTYENGLDEKDTTTRSGIGKAQFNVSRGYHLPATIMEDTTYTEDRLYIVSQDVVIPEGVKVTFEEGCEIQFYDERDYVQNPKILVYGSLIFNGSNENMIIIEPLDSIRYAVCEILIENGGYLTMNYTECVSAAITDSNYIKNNYSDISHTKICNSRISMLTFDTCCFVGEISGSYIQMTIGDLGAGIIASNYIATDADAGAIYNKKYEYDYDTFNYTSAGVYSNNILYTYVGNSASSNSGIHFDGSVKAENNIFCSADDTNASTFMRIYEIIQSWMESSPTIFCQNAFSTGYQNYASQVIEGYYDSTGNPIVDVYGSLADASLLWPHVTNVEVFDKDGNPITRVGNEEITVRVTFNRAMDTTQDTFLTFSTIEPYADYRINGEWISDTVWEGTYSLKAYIENGQNYLKVNNACAAEDQTKVVFGEYQLHEFTIDTTAAMAMNLMAFPRNNGIELQWFQDDYDTLLGYNIYRSNSKDGNYVKLNPTILLPSDETFLDDNAEPGKTYWYTYTVVLTDFTESNPAGKVTATAVDTIAPNMYHTPVNQGYLNNNLIISCTATDNMAISTVTLYYRAVGATEWRTLNMSKQSDKYSAAIFGSELTLDGIEYYIVASDGINTINKGSAETPYTVVIKDASAISRKGDVDGDGVVTTKDALMLIQCINGDRILSDDEFKRADLNEDNDLSSFEALRILQYINGKVTTLEIQ